MNRRYRSIYQLARNNAGLTQLGAAEMLNISVRSLADYESGATIPHGDIVYDMADIYNAKWLGYEHLRISTKVGQRCLPKINISDLAQSVLSLQKESIDVENVKPCMIKIASNGRIDEHEVQRWEEVTKEILEMAGAALSVVYHKGVT
ncbi:helix-turn-helix domain-containing protein [Clostridium sp. Cult2]|uniref:helix-turn-helix domain-containing protein n=1 Tax=Clostridium sp. Cult2 TaxID=2079003 RepID=UPI001F38BF62|nr:helix-turn-helix transcriptional regulator [Clostridium sp. Cult2]MCF6466384.1 transcriptional regulator [Clostridium sp. Cult2]